MVDRLDRKVQPLGEFGVGQAVVEQAQHLDLAGRQTRRVGQRRRAPARGHRGRPPASGDRGGPWPRPRRHPAGRGCPARGRRARVAGVDEGERRVVRHRKRWNSSAAASMSRRRAPAGTARRCRARRVSPSRRSHDRQLAPRPFQTGDRAAGQQLAASGQPVVGHARRPSRTRRSPRRRATCGSARRTGTRVARHRRASPIPVAVPSQATSARMSDGHVRASGALGASNTRSASADRIVPLAHQQLQSARANRSATPGRSADRVRASAEW